MMQQFSRAVVKFGAAIVGVLALLFVGAGILLLCNPALILSLFVYGLGGGCLLFGAVALIGLLGSAFRA